ncbi:MAG: helix-turn-helix transcriptional regulator [Ruminococcus sp.]|nr:helix-turn-helix transcriptional regulator [Ruminococcus sp.]
MYKNNLYEARDNAHITQAEMAEKLNMNVTVYGRYERGERDIPLSIAVQMAEIFDVSLDYIACRSESRMGIQEDRDNKLIEETVFAPLIEETGDEQTAMIEFIKSQRQQLDFLENEIRKKGKHLR